MLDSDISIKGAAFGEVTRLKGLLSNRMNIIYGRNGSGKSTIARAFREQQPDQRTKGLSRRYELSFDGSGNLPDIVCGHLRVFNEDFIDENVKSSDSLKSIIRIGTSAQLDGPIKDSQKLIKDYQERQQTIQGELDVLNGVRAGSIDEAEKKVREKDGMKKPGGYLSRIERIEGKRCSLIERLYRPVIDFDPNDTLPMAVGSAAKALDADIDRYLSFQAGAPVPEFEPDYGHLPDLATINALLSQTVKPARLEPEEQAVFDELYGSLAAENLLPKTESLIVKSSLNFCPLCHQPITVLYKHELEQRLVKFRDKTVEEFKERVVLIQGSFTGILVTLPMFPSGEYADDIAKAAELVGKMEDFIGEVRKALGNKAENPYYPLATFDVKVFDALVADCKAAIDTVAADVRAFNKSLQEKDALRGEIDRMNIRLAYHENKFWIDKLNELKARKAKLEQENIDLEAKVVGEKRKIATLRSQIDQVDDAREQINHYLDIIFGPGKMQLAPAGKDAYKLQMKRGDAFVDIPQRAISSGERNALALAYFFACVMEQKDKDYDYGDETLLVIDDPVSSFDAENKAGVISLISNQCKKVLDGNRNSKVLILTHDYTTLKDLCFLRQTSIAPGDSDKWPDGNVSWRYGLLSIRHELNKKDCRNIRSNMEYGSELWEIFLFADRRDPETFDGLEGIGNTIRRFAETYATMIYKCKWYDLFTNESRLECLPDFCRDSVLNYAIRNVLNSESHGSMDDYTPFEIQRSARILLTYMLYADEKHLRAYLVGNDPKNEGRIDRIREWFKK